MVIPSLRVLTAVLVFSLSVGLINGAALYGAEEQTDPVVQKIHGRTVTVTVPEGFQRIALQKLVSPRKGKAGRKGGAARIPEWQTIATEFPNGNAGEYTFRLGKLVGKRNLRVIGSRGEALPDTLLTNVTSFAPDPAGFTIDGAAPVSLGDPGDFSSSASVDGSLSVTGSLSAAGGVSEESREVVESDIWKVSGDRLYFFNQTRGLQIFDVQNPDDPALISTLRMPGAGEQMYLLGDRHAVLLARKSSPWVYGYLRIGVFESDPVPLGAPAVSVAGNSDVTFSISASTTSVRAAVASFLPFRWATNDNEVAVVEAAPGTPKVVARIPYKGSLTESRLVGGVLYLVVSTYETTAGNTQQVYGSKVVSIDLSDPANPVERASIFYPGYGHTITATDKFLFIARQTTDGGSLEVIDISSPIGAIAKRGSISLAGTVDDKFKIHQAGDVLTVVTSEMRVSPGESPIWRRTAPITVVTNYSLGNPDAPIQLGSVELAPGETVRATRFDNGRAYVVTFVQRDPLWVVDVASTGAPKLLGHVEVPGFSTYIEPLGDRLVTLGLIGGKPAVSLFDVSEPAAPKVLSQVGLSDTERSYTEATWNEKAFTVLPEENLILLPYYTYASNNFQGSVSGVQLFELLPDKVVKRGAIQRDISPRRTTVLRDRIIAISSRELISVDATNLDQPKVTAEIEISWPVNRVVLVGDYLLQFANGDGYSTENASLTVSPAMNPDESLATVDFGSRAILDATVKDGILYVFQAPQRIFGVYIKVTAVDGSAAQQQQFNGSFSCYDVANLPSISRIGSTDVPVEVGEGYTNGPLLWLNSTTLLWTQDTWRYIYRPVFETQASITGVQGQNKGYWYSDVLAQHQKRLLAFDVTAPSAPKLASRLQIGFNEPWDVGNAVVSHGAVYFSYKHLGKVVPQNPFVSLNEAALRNSSTYKLDPAAELLKNRHFLQVIDYGDPTAPFIRENAVNIPGQLRAVSKSGQLLYTVGQYYSLAGSTNETVSAAALHVSAFDGTTAHLVDQLPLTSSWQPLLVANDTIAVLYPEREKRSLPPESQKLSRLETWTLGDEGRFRKLDSLTVDHDTSLVAVNDLWVTYANPNALRLIDGTKPEALIDLGTHTIEGSGSFWSSFGPADGDVHRGLWVPLDTYGVEPVLLTP